MSGLWWALSDAGQVRAIKIMSALVGLALICLGVFGVHRAWSDRNATVPYPGGVITTGTVVDWDVRGSKATGETYIPIIEYSDAAGRAHRFRGPGAATRVHVGDTVAVSYRPNEPSQVRDLSAAPPGWQVGMIASLVLLVAVPVVALRTIRRWRRPARNQTAFGG